MPSSVRDGQGSRNPCYLFAEVASLSLSRQTTFHTRANEFCHNFWSMPRPEPLSPLPPSRLQVTVTCVKGVVLLLVLTLSVDHRNLRAAQMLHSLPYGVRPKTFSLRHDRALALSVCGKRGQRCCTFVAMLCSLSLSLSIAFCLVFFFFCLIMPGVGVNSALYPRSQGNN